MINNVTPDSQNNELRERALSNFRTELYKFAAENQRILKSAIEIIHNNKDRLKSLLSHGFTRGSDEDLWADLFDELLEETIRRYSSQYKKRSFTNDELITARNIIFYLRAVIKYSPQLITELENFTDNLPVNGEEIETIELMTEIEKEIDSIRQHSAWKVERGKDANVGKDGSLRWRFITALATRGYRNGYKVADLEADVLKEEDRYGYISVLANNAKQKLLALTTILGLKHTYTVKYNRHVGYYIDLVNEQ